MCVKFTPTFYVHIYSSSTASKANKSWCQQLKNCHQATCIAVSEQDLQKLELSLLSTKLLTADARSYFHDCHSCLNIYSHRYQDRRSGGHKKQLLLRHLCAPSKSARNHNCLVLMQIPNVVLIIAILVGTPCLHTEYK